MFLIVFEGTVHALDHTLNGVLALDGCGADMGLGPTSCCRERESASEAGDTSDASVL